MFYLISIVIETFNVATERKLGTKFKLWLIQLFLFLFLTPKPFCTGGNVLEIESTMPTLMSTLRILRTLPPVQKGFGVKNKNKNGCINHSLNFVATQQILCSEHKLSPQKRSTCSYLHLQRFFAYHVTWLQA